MQNNQCGRSMIEMLGVLAIVGVLSVGGLSGYNQAMNQYRINKTLTQITEISSRLSVIGDQTSSYEGLSNVSAIKMGVAPNELISGNNLINIYGGNVTIQNSNLTATDTDMAYVIQYTNLPQAACMTLATQDWQNGRNSNMIGIGVGSGADKLSDISSSLFLNCEGKITNGEVVACPNGCKDSTGGVVACTGSTATKPLIPLDPSSAVQGCSCSGNACVFVMKLF